MTTTHETPALPGDLTDEMIERAAQAAWDLRQDLGSWANASESWKARTRAQMRAALAAAGVALEVDGSTSDGHHTFDELYAYRMAYHAHAAVGWLAAGIPVVKSRRHSDGELCFGGGWFIVIADLPTGQVSNHYREEHWDLFKVPAVTDPPEYDGHTPSDALQRLLEADLDLDAERSELARKGRRYADWKREKGDAGTADIITWLVDAIEIPRIGPAPHKTMHVRCDCVPSLGPAHCHDCDVPYSECRARVAPVTPSREERIEAATWALIEGDTDTSDRGVSDEHYRERRAEVERIAPILAPPAPSPDREKLIAKAKKRVAEWSSTESLPSDVRLIHELLAALTVPPAPSPDRELLLTEANAAFDAAGRIPQGTMDHESQWLPFARLYNVTERLIDALAVPPVVNEAKLAEFIAEELMTDDAVSEGWSWQKVGATARRIAKFAVAERQREWLGEA